MQARPGNWYFGWNIVAAATFITLLTVGMRLGIGPFFIPMAEDLGFSRTLLATIIAVGMLFYGIGMPIAGTLSNCFGPRYWSAITARFWRATPRKKKGSRGAHRQSRKRPSGRSKAKSSTITQPKSAISLFRRSLILKHKVLDNQTTFDPSKTDF